MRSRYACLLGAGILTLLVPMSARARVVVYTAHGGETPEAIAADYYGNRSLALFIIEGNGLHGGHLKAGQKIRIPTAFGYRVRHGDSFEALAQRFLEDKRRAPFLAGFNKMRPSDRLREGQDLIIPFQHVHQAEVPESLPSVARAFYGDTSKARLLADYNFRSATLLAKGERIVVPIAHVRVRAVRLAAAREEKAATNGQHAGGLTIASAQEAQRREVELAARVSKQLAAVEKAYKDGSYSDVPSTLDKLLTEEDPSEAQLAEIFRLKAFAYVALGLDELAVNAFREVITRKPSLVLDEATVSPKIRAALERAQKAAHP